MRRRTTIAIAAIAALLLVAPTAATATGKGKPPWAGGNFGKTTLAVDSATLDALIGLGVAPGAVAPGTLEGATYAFPITNPLPSALGSGKIRHRGGISLSAGATTVELTDFTIKLRKGLLFGRVNGSDPVALLDLDASRTETRARHGKVKIGPVGTTLTEGAADALNAAFGTTALSDDTVIGDATVCYRVVGRW